MRMHSHRTGTPLPLKHLPEIARDLALPIAGYDVFLRGAPRAGHVVARKTARPAETDHN